MSDLKEYVVTCRSRDDLDQLYDDMETPGGNLYIPDRAVDLVHRRAISRNTHYMLTDAEAVDVGNDPRVLACELTAEEQGFVPDYLWEQTGDFEKTKTILEQARSNLKNLLLTHVGERLNQPQFIRHSKDFYNSRGTDESFKLLFKSLYNEEVDIVRPADYGTLKSTEKASGTAQFVVEPDGNINGYNTCNYIDLYSR